MTVDALLISNQFRYTVIGITSFGEAFCGKIGVYTKVHYYLDWIESTVWNT
jgi:secreted trypsin-like serine protease